MKNICFRIEKQTFPKISKGCRSSKLPRYLWYDFQKYHKPVKSLRNFSFYSFDVVIETPTSKNDTISRLVNLFHHNGVRFN